MLAPEGIFYEDIQAGECIRLGPYQVTRDEIIEFARAWDPLPIHVDEQAAAAGPFGGLTASGLHILGIRQRLVLRLPIRAIATFGFDEVRFPAPVRPGDALTLHLSWIDKRLSASKPDRGIVGIGFALFNQHAVEVMRHRDTILIWRRPTGA